MLGGGGTKVPREDVLGELEDLDQEELYAAFSGGPWWLAKMAEWGSSCKGYWSPACWSMGNQAWKGKENNLIIEDAGTAELILLVIFSKIK